MRQFSKILRLGTARTYGGRAYSVFCKVTLKDGLLSITGVEGPLPSGNALGGCGQIVMSLKPKDINPAPGWTLARLVEFLRIWDRWHLNDMRAGTAAQRAWLDAHPEVRADYTKTCEALAAAGLNPDPNGPDGKPYRYGSAWLREDVPDEVLDFLEALPDSDRKPAWV